MNYKRIYNNLIERAKLCESLDCYSEKHHVIPKCQKGNDVSENIVTLSAREHFIAHWLLARMYPKNKGLCFAFFCMCHQERPGQHRYVNSRAYDEARRRFSENISGEKNVMYGKHHTEETKRSISDALKGRYQTEESNQKRSDVMKGEKNPMFGRTGEKGPNAKLTDAQTASIPLEKAQGASVKDLMKKYDLSYGYVYDILKNQTGKR